ncbi:MAG: 4-hydroxy-3-methylbut-2-enyl diphosphate reductase, partial [Candidatus Atribacteria bacterium]|nr:4-hydroxy-3-methylbut-2-enyl diphosphate reductase [Candidatus Atribacteria bacterium]
LHLVATEEGKKNYWIESPDELEEDWFHSSDTILVVSGASTPDCSVHELVSRLQIIGGCR